MENLYAPHIEFKFDKESLIADYFTKTLDEADLLADQVGLKCEIHETDTRGYENHIRWYSSEALELLHYVVTKHNSNYSGLFHPLSTLGTMKYSLCHPNAIEPTKANVSDSGFDLNLVSIVKQKHGVTWYSTGVKVQPPHGYYFDLVPRSSMSKSGYILMNSTGIIDQSYRGEIMVALKKVCEDAEDISLPCKMVQLIPRVWTHMNAVQVKEHELTETTRNDGGFGSTSC